MSDKKINKEFRLSSWAIDNPTIIYIIMGLLLVLGLVAYFSMPRENFPEIKGFSLVGVSPIESCDVIHERTHHI